MQRLASQQQLLHCDCRHGLREREREFTGERRCCVLSPVRTHPEGVPLKALAVNEWRLRERESYSCGSCALVGVLVRRLSLLLDAVEFKFCSATTMKPSQGGRG